MNIDNYQFGLYEKAVPEGMEWPRLLDYAGDAGFSFVEISVDESDYRLSRMNWSLSEKKDFVKAVLNSGLKVPTMCLSGHRRYPIGSCYEDIRAAGMKLMFDAIDFASDTGIRIVQLAGYDAAYEEESTQQSQDNYLSNLEKSLRYAEKRGVTLAIENMGIIFMPSIERVMTYVKMFDSPYLQAYPDLGNSSAMGNDIVLDLASARGHIAAMHIKDTTPGVVRRIPFGKGTVDFRRASEAVKTAEFKGMIVIEMWADESTDTMEELKAAKNFVIENMF